MRRALMQAMVFAAAAAAAGAASCTPEIADTTSLVLAPRLLAVQATPAEARPGERITLRALDAGPAGAAGRALDWALCTARPPLTAPGTLSPDCQQVMDAGMNAALVPIGAGATVETAMPANVCRTFGPDQPAPQAGQPPGRPVDPDATGGYYQPIRVRAPDEPDGRADAFFDARALCNVATATPAQQAEFDRGYRPNANPALASLTLPDGTAVPAAEAAPDAVTGVPAGSALPLRAAWPSCPAPGADACGGAETFLRLDLERRAVGERREAITVSWFATAGRFAAGRTGRGEDEAGAATDSDNTWTAPATPGDVWLWIVLRDSRGGASWSSHRLRVE